MSRNGLELDRRNMLPLNWDELEWRNHPNGGGRIAVTALVAPEVFVGLHATIEDQAVVTGLVRLDGRARIGEYAVVRGRVHLHDDSTIDGHAYVSGNVILRKHARITDHARVDGGVTLDHYARLGGSVVVNEQSFYIDG